MTSSSCICISRFQVILSVVSRWNMHRWRKIVEFLQRHIDSICQSIPNYTWADFDYSYLLASNPDRLIGTHKASIGNLRWLRKTEITCLGSAVAGRFRIDAWAFVLLIGGYDELIPERTSHFESVLDISVLKHAALGLQQSECKTVNSRTRRKHQ